VFSLGRRWRHHTSLLTIPFALSCAIGLANCRAASGPVALSVGSSTTGHSIQPGFVGLSMEYPDVLGYAGSDPAALNPVFQQLVKNLAPGQQPVLRFGGQSADWSWFASPGTHHPAGIRYNLAGSWTAVAHALATALNARLILGIDLEADSGSLAGAEATGLLSGVGRGYIAGFELGNEPELYHGFPWYEVGGHKVFSRPKSWNFTAYVSDFSKVARSLPAVPLASPSIGSPAWMTYLPRFLASQPHTSLVTLHRYPLKRCSKSHHLSTAELLSDDSSRGLADSVARYVSLAHSRRMPLRIDEMNSISCGGQHGLSDTFASSLWAVDALFEMARVGVDGVNIHSTPSSVNELFRFHRGSGGWTGEVRPIYYGLMMFAQAAPPGSRLLRLTGNHENGPVKAWATKATDGTIRVTLINRTPHTQTVKLRAPAPNAAATSKPALQSLRAPNVHAQSGVTLNGQSFGSETTTGVLVGGQASQTLTPVKGVYTIKLPATSAALLTIPT
jgi:Glycosyl hydrolase family 79 C-terminal beta domain